MLVSIGYELAVWGFRSYNVTDIIQHLEFSVCTSTLGVDDTLRDSLTIEMCEEIDQVEVLEKERTIGANPLGGLRVHDL